MKIYPGVLTPTVVHKPLHDDILLSYAGADALTYDARVRTLRTADGTEREISPFEEFTTDGQVFFDQDGEPVAQTCLTPKGSRYVYVPKEYVSFTPARFSMTALVKKCMQYHSGRDYNINALAGGDKNLTLAKKLLQFFGDAPLRGLCPNNISVNQRSKNIVSLTAGGAGGNDFLFLSLPSLENLDSNLIKSCRAAKTNLWISLDNVKDIFKKNNTETYTATLAVENLYKNKQYQIQSAYYFDAETVKLDGPLKEYEMVRVFHESRTPALVLHSPQNGYVILTQRDFIDRLADHVKLFYELLTFFYFCAYRQTSPMNLWITNEAVEYRLHKNNPFNRTHEAVTLRELVAKTDTAVGEAYVLADVKTDQETVIFTHMDAKGRLCFYKTVSDDPPKKKGEICVLNAAGDVVQYQNQVIKTIEQELKLEKEALANGCFKIWALPFKSSGLRIDLRQRQSFITVAGAKSFCLIAIRGEVGNLSELKLIESAALAQYPGAAVLAQVDITARESVRCHDIRVLGGGLKASAPKDYGLMDIGNIRGRPYRKGAGLIVRLPDRLRPYDAVIRAELKKHQCSAQELIIIYERGGA